MKHKYGSNDDRKSRIVNSMLTKYDPDNVYETNPIFTMSTSYTINKGKRMYLCCRSKKFPFDLTDLNTLTFVALHELSHIGNYDGWGHTEDFWSVFKFVLQNAVYINIYDPIDYKEYPQYYCGIHINYQPLFDSTLAKI